MSESPERGTVEHICDRYSVEWDETPDSFGAMGCGMKWFGECRQCERKVYYQYFPDRNPIRDCATGETPEEIEISEEAAEL